MPEITYKSVVIKFLPILFLFGLNTFVLAQSKHENPRVYIKIEIKGLACPYCAYGMEKELKKISGVEKVDIELKKGLAYISTPISQKPSIEDLTKIITDAGFTVGKIQYNSIPFKEE